MTKQQQDDTLAALKAAREAKQMLEADLCATVNEKLTTFHNLTGLSCHAVDVVMVDVRTMDDPVPRLILDHVRVVVALE